MALRWWIKRQSSGGRSSGRISCSRESSDGNSGGGSLLVDHSVSTQPMAPRCPSPILPKKLLKLLWLV